MGMLPRSGRVGRYARRHVSLVLVLVLVVLVLVLVAVLLLLLLLPRLARAVLGAARPGAALRAHFLRAPAGRRVLHHHLACRASAPLAPRHHRDRVHRQRPQQPKAPGLPFVRAPRTFTRTQRRKPGTEPVRRRRGG